MYPDARFILTVRNPIIWLNSEIQQNLTTASYPVWKNLEELRYSRYGNKFSDKDIYLSELPYTYPVDSYLSYWRDHINMVIEAVPPERLLVIDTMQINDSLESISEFLTVPLDAIDAKHAHASAVPAFNVYEYVDIDYVIEQTKKICGDTLDLLKLGYAIDYNHYISKQELELMVK
jgi:hypothetical protein